MSISKVMWRSPEILKRRKLFNAKQLNDISLQSLKFQTILFLFIIIEMCLNVSLRIFHWTNRSMFMYMIICKTILAINLVFIVSYTIQIIQARLVIYLVIRENTTENIVKSLLFEMVPQLQYYYERLKKCDKLSNWLQKDAIEQDRIKVKLEEERRKTLHKVYIPSLYSHFHSYNETYPLQENVYRPQQSFYGGNANDVVRSVYCSTPNARRRVTQSMKLDSLSQHSSLQHMSVCDERSICNPDMRGDSRMCSSDSFVIRYQSSTPSPSHINLYSPLSEHASSRYQSGILSEIPSSEVWQRLGINSKHLDQWAMNMRQWIHGTIISRVVQEIEKLNRKFVQLGINDVVIGESNVQTLRQLANQPGNHFPTIIVLINFLDCSKDQGYVVNRIKELSQGCSLGKFQWDSGSTGARHPWKEHLPNDSMLILHLLMTYIDSRVHSNLHGVRTFSQQFIIDTLDNKEPSDLRDICALLQSNVQPPHFKVIYDQTIYSIAAGRRNLIDCLIVFFFKVYRNEGNLRWLNLGRSGLNLNWIFDECK